MRAVDHVDVFASGPYTGNPVAVVHGADGLADDAMQRFAHWMNLSETTFVLEPSDADADYRVRIFMPSAELPFAGHPTLGTCHAWLERHPEHDREAVVQECGVGLVEVRRAGGTLAFVAPPLVRGGPVEDHLVGHIASLLNIERVDVVAAQWVDNGPGWVAVLLASAEAVLALRPGAVDRFVGVVGPCARERDVAFEVRAFFPKDGATVEDSVTGSLNASLAQWLTASGRASPPYIVSQGTALGRRGRVQVTQDEDGGIWIGGATATRASGSVDL